MSVGSFILGLIILAAGIASIKFNRPLADSFGSSSVADHLGPGRKYDVFKLYGLIACLIGLIVMFGIHAYLFELALSPFINLIN